MRVRRCCWVANWKMRCGDRRSCEEWTSTCISCCCCCCQQQRKQQSMQVNNGDEQHASTSKRPILETVASASSCWRCPSIGRSFLLLLLGFASVQCTISSAILNNTRSVARSADKLQGTSSVSSSEGMDLTSLFSSRASRKLTSDVFVREICGRQFFPTARIVGGNKSSFGQWPWLISLRQWKAATFAHKCGAALINENWAITAAHCVEDASPQELLLRLGEHDVSSEKEQYGYVERRVQLVATHPKFDPRTFEYDLAVVRFDIPIAFQPHIVPICLPEDDADFLGDIGYVAGWGRLYAEGPLPPVLQQVVVPVVDNSQCENMYRRAGFNEYIPRIFICAGYRSGRKDSCTGDSGGPFVIERRDSRWLLAGVSSWGIGCGEPNRPGVYTRVSEFRDWIKKITAF